MLDFDKMTVAEHEAYKEMQRKAEAFDRIAKNLKKYDEQAIDSLNVNYHDFGADTAHMVDEFKEGDRS